MAHATTRACSQAVAMVFTIQRIMETKQPKLHLKQGCGLTTICTCAMLFTRCSNRVCCWLWLSVPAWLVIDILV